MKGNSYSLEHRKTITQNQIVAKNIREQSEYNALIGVYFFHLTTDNFIYKIKLLPANYIYYHRRRSKLGKYQQVFEWLNILSGRSRPFINKRKQNKYSK